MSEGSLTESNQWLAVDQFGEQLGTPFDTEEEAWDWLEEQDNYTGFAEPKAWHEGNDDKLGIESRLLRIRTDREADEIVMGERTAISVFGDGGSEMVIDHESAEDGYVAFVNPDDLDERVTVQFREVS